MHNLIGPLLAQLRGVWRYRWLALIASWLIAIAGWLYVAQLPDQYRASARVHVDTESMLRPLLRGMAVSTNLSQRVTLMTRILLTRPNLEKVARMSDLHLAAHTDAQMNAVTERLAAGITIDGTDRQNLYTLAYTSEDPEHARTVVQSLLTLFVEGALGESREDSSMARSFIEEQIAEYEQRLQAAEQRLAEFRRKNVGLLPGDRGDYYQRLQEAQSQLQEARLRLREAEERRNEVRRQLAGEAPTFGIVRGAGGVDTSALDSRIERLQQRLDELLLSYTEQHPDVVTLHRTIAELEEQKAEKLALHGEGAAGGNAALNGNPVYQQMRMSLSSAEVEVSSLRVRVQQYQRRVEELQRLVDTIPGIEAELKRLDRDYSVNRENYEQLLQRRESASLSQNIEEHGDQIQFRVVEPPRLPLSPAEPNRPLLFALALFLGIAGGMGVALLASQLRPVFDERRLLNSITGFPVLGSVTWVRDVRTRMRQRVEQLSFFSAAAALVAAFGLVLFLGGVDLRLVTGWSV